MSRLLAVLVAVVVLAGCSAEVDAPPTPQAPLPSSSCVIDRDAFSALVEQGATAEEALAALCGGDR